MKNKYNTLLFLALCLFGLINNSGIHADEYLSKSAWSLSLPEAVTSFGASRDEKFLYVYGGHVGDAHVYSKETHSKSFVRLNLKSGKKLGRNFHLMILCRGLAWQLIKVGFLYLEVLRQQMRRERNQTLALLIKFRSLIREKKFGVI